MSFEHNNLFTSLGSGKSFDISVDQIIEEMNQIDKIVSKINGETERELVRLQCVLDEYNSGTKLRSSNSSGRRGTSRGRRHKWAHALRTLHCKVRTLRSHKVRSKLLRNRSKDEGQRDALESSNVSFEPTPEAYFRALSSPTFEDTNWPPEFPFGEGDNGSAESIISEEEPSVRLNYIKYRVLNRLSETRNSGQNVQFMGPEDLELNTPLFFRVNTSSGGDHALYFPGDRGVIRRQIAGRINRLWPANQTLSWRKIHST